MQAGSVTIPDHLQMCAISVYVCAVCGIAWSRPWLVHTWGLTSLPPPPHTCYVPGNKKLRISVGIRIWVVVWHWYSCCAITVWHTNDQCIYYLPTLLMAIALIVCVMGMKRLRNIDLIAPSVGLWEMVDSRFSRTAFVCCQRDCGFGISLLALTL